MINELERLLKQRNYKEYNRLLKLVYNIDPVITLPEIKGGQRVHQYDPNWFEYDEYNSAFEREQ